MTRKRFGEALLASFLFFIPGLASGITTTITENSLQFSAGPRVLASCGASTGAPWGRHAYSTVTFRANASGSHHFVTTALTGLDNKNILFLYQGAFNPASPSTGQLACHDGGVTFSVTGPAPVPADLVGLTPVKATDGVAFNALLEAPLRISSGIDSANDACAALPAGTFAGAIAVIRRGNCNFSVKVNNASAAGAIAVIIAMNTPSATPITATVPGTTIPAFTVTEAQGDALRDFGQANPATATARLVEGISSNLAASAVYSLVVTGQSPIDSCGEPSLVPANVAASSGIAETLSLGAYHSCATFQGGATQCWGTNADGQLGDESVGLARSPAAVPGLSSGVTAIAAGYAHTCARLTGGAVKCWGANGSGRVGDNSTATRLAPVDVAGLSSGVVTLAAGGAHTCALLTGGAVKCWGANDWGQVGDNSTTTRLTPVDVAGLSSGVTAIAAGYDHTCALLTGGAVKCWGDNFWGQLGDNSTNSQFAPVDVAGLSSGVTAIAAGYAHTCARLTGGAVKCWGANGSGQVGDNSTATRLAPVDVSGLSSGVVTLSAGGFHTCALLTGGAVKCWGRNTSGQVGDNSTTTRLTPADVAGLSSGVTAIAAGYDHTCARLSGGALKCWGLNQYGQLGDASAGTCPVSRWTGTASLLLAPQVTSLVTVSGTISGLGSGKSLVLLNNGSDDLTVLANGAFAFATPLTPGAAYAVTVKTQPAGQVCTVTNGSGTASGNVTNVAISCAEPIPTLSEWVMILLASLIGMVAFGSLRRRAV